MSLYFNFGAFQTAALHSGQCHKKSCAQQRTTLLQFADTYCSPPQNLSELERLSEPGSVSLLGLEAMLIQLQTKFSIGKPHTRISKTFSVLMFVAVRWIGMYNLITYEMACTVNALKFFFCLDEGIHFCTFNTISDFPIGMLCSVQICK